MAGADRVAAAPVEVRREVPVAERFAVDGDQRRLDERDPKLALAPLSDDPYLYFPTAPGADHG